jgi:hypothetical protein
MPPSERLEDLLLKIERSQPKTVPSEPSAEFAAEKAYLERQRVLVELEGERQDITERKKYAFRFFVLAFSWVLVIAFLLFFEGFGARLNFHVSNPVLLAAIGSTTANILGVLYVVAHYLFKEKS